MGQIAIKVCNKDWKTMAVSRGENETHLVYTAQYQEGDHFLIEFEECPAFYMLQLDDAKGSSLVYVTGNVDYQIPFGEKRINICPKAFTGEKHLLSVRKAYPWEYEAYRNLALNVNDQHGEVSCFPHASANVETRGESVFAALNAIDGVKVTECHGEWPYESWGINRDPKAVFKIEFGRLIKTDRVILYTRADFPHDNWWQEAQLSFSDGTQMKLKLHKTGAAQEFTFPEKTISWLELGEMIPSDEPSPFPALVQIEVYGTEG